MSRPRLQLSMREMVVLVAALAVILGSMASLNTYFLSRRVSTYLKIAADLRASSVR